MTKPPFPARASAVSRQLALSGLTTLPSGTPRSRAGVRVIQSGPELVAVRADFDSAAAERVHIDEAAEILAERYDVHRLGDAAILVRAAAQ